MRDAAREHASAVGARRRPQQALRGCVRGASRRGFLRYAMMSRTPVARVWLGAPLGRSIRRKEDAAEEAVAPDEHHDGGGGEEDTERDEREAELVLLGVRHGVPLGAAARAHA